MMFSEFEGRGLRTRMRAKIQGHKNSERMRRAEVAETHLSPRKSDSHATRDSLASSAVVISRSLATASDGDIPNIRNNALHKVLGDSSPDCPLLSYPEGAHL